MTLTHGALGWSAVCDCGIPWSYSLTLGLCHLLFTLNYFFCGDSSVVVSFVSVFCDFTFSPVV